MENYNDMDDLLKLRDECIDVVNSYPELKQLLEKYPEITDDELKSLHKYREILDNSLDNLGIVE